MDEAENGSESGQATPSAAEGNRSASLETSLALALEPLWKQSTSDSKTNSSETNDTTGRGQVGNLCQEERATVEQAWKELKSSAIPKRARAHPRKHSEITEDQFERVWRAMKRHRRPGRSSSSTSGELRGPWRQFAQKRPSTALESLLGIESVSSSAGPGKTDSSESVPSSQSSRPRATWMPSSMFMRRLAGLQSGRGRTGRSNTLLRAQEQWEQFKEEAGVREELEHYKKSERRFTDRLEFLTQTDYREWAYEQTQKRQRKSNAAMSPAVAEKET
jgi:hypothetical protein